MNGVESWVPHPRRVFVFAARVGYLSTTLAAKSENALTQQKSVPAIAVGRGWKFSGLALVAEGRIELPTYGL